MSSEELIEVTGLDVINQFRDDTQLYDERHILSDSSYEELKEVKALKQAGSAYVLMEKVGEGAMGLVHLAKNKFLRRKVAFKELHSQMASDENHGRFLNEVQITAQLDHPNIVPVYTLEVNQDQSIAYAMKLVEGRTFKELIAQVRAAYSGKITFKTEFTLASRLAIFLKVCDAMAFSHNKGIIHRDLKPANIMIGPYNEVYVMDWGIARRFQSNRVAKEDMVEITEFHFDEKEKGQLVGTPRYMSPEQARGLNEQLDHRSDLYALGLILFELVTLKRPVTGKNMIEVIKKAIKGQLEPYLPYQAGQKLPAEIHSIILKATQRKRAERYEDVQGFADDIRRYLRNEKVLAHKDTPLQQLMRMVSRHQQTILLFVLATIMVGTLSTLGITYYKKYALAVAELRKEKLESFFTDMSDHSQLVNNYFLKLEGLLLGLASSSQLVLERGLQTKDKLYFHEDFKYLSTMPMDLTLSKIHGRQISLEWPVFQVDSTLNRESTLPALYQLSPLKYHLKRLLLESEMPEAISFSPDKQSQLIMDEGTPIVHGYLKLKKGYGMIYPGSLEPSKLPSDFNLPGGVTWRLPVRGPSQMGLVLAAQSPLYSQSREIIGYVGIDSSMENLLNKFMKMSNWPSIKNTYLLNEEGLVLISAKDDLSSFKTESTDAIKLNPFSIQSVIESIKMKKSGYVEQKIAGIPHLFAYYRLNSVGWYFIIEADVRQLIR